jgi:large subunit ribosomal protein L18
MTLDKNERFEMRKFKVRSKISGSSSCPRICVHRSNRYMHVQVIDDEKAVTLVSVSSLMADLKPVLEKKTKTEQAKIIGENLAKKALAAGISKVVFDRRGYKYHGRVKALADAARANGLKF